MIFEPNLGFFFNFLFKCFIYGKNDVRNGAGSLSNSQKTNSLEHQTVPNGQINGTILFFLYHLMFPCVTEPIFFVLSFEMF